MYHQSILTQSDTFLNFTEGHKYRPKIIQSALYNLNKFLEKPMDYLHVLRRTYYLKRQERLEGRYRDGLVLGVILHYLDLATFQFGVPNANGTFFNPSLSFIAIRLGWRCEEDNEADKEAIKEGKYPKLRGIKRVYRALKNLQGCGYIETNVRFRKTKDLEGYESIPAVRKVNIQLLYDLGQKHVEIVKAYEKAVKRVFKKRDDYSAMNDCAIVKYGAYAPERSKNTFYDAPHPNTEPNYKNDKLPPQIRSIWNMAVMKAQKKRAKKEKPIEKTFTQQDQQNALSRIDQIMQLKTLPENQLLSSKEFYLKYPHLSPT